MVNFFIFRHGQTPKNLANKWQGSGCNDSLNATGFKQAEELAQKTLKFNLDHLCVSPLLRAQQTASAIIEAYNHKLPMTTYNDLREVYFGDIEGVSFSEVRARFGNYFVDQMLDPTFDTWDLRYPNGESKHETFTRVYNCLKEIAHLKSGNIGIVCHAGVLSSLNCGLQLKDVDFSNCSILHLQYDETTDRFTQIFD